MSAGDLRRLIQETMNDDVVGRIESGRAAARAYTADNRISYNGQTRATLARNKGIRLHPRWRELRGVVDELVADLNVSVDDVCGALVEEYDLPPDRVV